MQYSLVDRKPWCSNNGRKFQVQLKNYAQTGQLALLRIKDARQKIASRTRYLALYELMTCISHTALSNHPHQHRQTLE